MLHAGKKQHRGTKGSQGNAPQVYLTATQRLPKKEKNNKIRGEGSRVSTLISQAHFPALNQTSRDLGVIQKSPLSADAHLWLPGQIAHIVCTTQLDA